MSHEIIDNIYFIYDVEGNVIFQVELTAEPNNQIVIRTNKEVYAGPIDFISFNENI
jgi:hypothetical protein